MHGIGNDYIFVDCFEQKIDNAEELSIAVSHRHFGIGADGLVLILPSERADCSMRMFNADGSEGKMCGNAIRCVGKYFFENICGDSKTITVDTLSGIKRLTIYTNDHHKATTISVEMGRANFCADQIPVLCEEAYFIDNMIVAEDEKFVASVVSMGNPHCVIFVDEVSDFAVERYGKSIEHNPIFPERVNAEFVEIIDQNTISMRVWERGSGETMACGTGACASVAAAVRTQKLPPNKEICVKLLGGNLYITCADDYTMTMKGTAKEVFRGNYPL